MNTESAVDFPGNRRLHVALTVSDLERSKRFYEVLLGVAPSKERPRYAKFEPADPSVNITLNEVDGEVGRDVATQGGEHGVRQRGLVRTEGGGEGGGAGRYGDEAMRCNDGPGATTGLRSKRR